MTDTLEEDHAQVALILLRANATLTGIVFDGVVPSPTPEPPYVLVYTTVAHPYGPAGQANALNAAPVTYETTWYCHCVGLTAAAARGMQMQVRTSLNGVRPTIATRSCGLIRQTESLAPDRDESTGRLVMDAVAVYALTTAPG